MIINRDENTNVVYLTYEALNAIDGIAHGFSTRCGGVSKGHLSGMNLSYSRGDEKGNVDKNYELISSAIGFAPENMVFTDQTHTANVRVTGRSDCGKGYSRERDYTDVDGLITNEKNVVLSAFFADCVPLMFADPVNGAIGLSHSGWRGTVQRIGKRTVELMSENYGSRPEDIIAVIGPSICQSCYEVSSDVAEAFMAEFDDRWHGDILYKGREEGKYQLNLQKANEIIFIETGLNRDNIQLPDICTCHNPQFLFSHRASNGMRGNLGAFIEIK